MKTLWREGKVLFRKEPYNYIIFALIVFLSRIPFLFTGFGMDGDSWAVAVAAKSFLNTGVYEVSRFPGYPVHELISSVVSWGGYFAANLLTTIVSTLGFIAFALILKQLRFKYIFLASFALAAVPVIYISSVTNIDYCWALTCILYSYLFLLRKKIPLAGIFLGLAIGCRITSGALLIPFCLMLLPNNNFKKHIRNILLFAFFSLATALLCYLPVLFKYGVSFFTFYDVAYPSIPKVLYKFFFETWGIIGTLAIIVGVLLIFLPDSITARKYLFPKSINERYVVTWLIAIDIYIVAFLYLPVESGYLIPIIPFVIILLGKYLYQTAFKIFAALLIASPFAFGLSPEGKVNSPDFSASKISLKAAGENIGIDPLKGPSILYESRREIEYAFTQKITLSLDTFSVPTLLLTGKWQNMVVYQQKKANAKLVLKDYISEEELLQYIGKNYLVYYLPTQDSDNLKKYRYDIKMFGAIKYD